jgi:hypothetical protein
VSPVKYELGFYIPEVDILHGHHGENLKSCVFSDTTFVARMPRRDCKSVSKLSNLPTHTSTSSIGTEPQSGRLIHRRDPHIHSLLRP